METTFQATTNREDIIADQLGGHYRWTPTRRQVDLQRPLSKGVSLPHKRVLLEAVSSREGMEERLGTQRRDHEK